MLEDNINWGENFFHLLSKVWDGEEISLKDKESVTEFTELLKDFTIFETESPNLEKAKKLLSVLSKKFPHKVSAKGNLYYEAFKILVVIGIFSEDENLLLERFSIHKDFTELEYKAADTIEKTSLNNNNRQDLRHLFTFTIDGEQTKDFDDALSFIEIDGEQILYIHIADVSHYIPIGSLLDKEARERRKTFYLIDQILPLFPENLSFSFLSLKEGYDRLSLTTKIVFDGTHIKSFEIFESIIHIKKNYSYKEMDEFLCKKENRHLSFLPKLLELSYALQKDRIEKNGGIDILLPNIYPFLSENKILLKVYNPQKNSAFIIRELMIWNNFLCAYYTFGEGKPFIYLSQEKPSQEYKIESHYILDRASFSRLGGILQRSNLSTENGGHFALGLSHYTQITSPIRRYIDVVLQRQLKCIIRNEALLYKEEDLLEEAHFFERGKSFCASLEAERQKYYLLKYHFTHLNESPLSGTVIKILSPTDCLVELSETQIICKVKYETPVNIGHEVKVKLHSIYPRLGIALGRII